MIRQKISLHAVGMALRGFGCSAAIKQQTQTDHMKMLQ